jgi:hypothetical protein
MSVATVLTGLYPPAVRERWGADISREVSVSGVRSWPDTLAGAARLWLHPSDWPETFAGQTRRVLTVTLFAITAATGLLLRAVATSTALTADVRHPVTSLWLAPVLLGIALGTPLPLLRGTALRRLSTLAVRTLTAPAAAVLAMVLMAWGGVAGQTTGFADAALVLYYWLTLGFVALRLCTLVARTGRTTALPTRRRLCAALLCMGAGLTLAAGQSLVALVQTGLHPDSLVETLTLGLLGAAAISVAHDLRRTRA